MKRVITGSLLLSAWFIGGCQDSHQVVTSNNPMIGNAPIHDPNEPKPDAPLTANTHYAAGQLAEQQGDVPRAITQYEAANNLDHNMTGPLLRLGLLYTQLGQFDQAVDAWNRYIKATKNDAAAYCNLGYTLELAGRSAEAESAYKSAIQRQPRNETARVNYGLMLARAGRISESLAQLQVVLTPAEAHYDVASVYESEGKKDAAKAEYRTALNLDPDMNDAQARLAALDTN